MAKLSEHIKHLQAILNEHGDLDVMHTQNGSRLAPTLPGFVCHKSRGQNGKFMFLEGIQGDDHRGEKFVYL